jgi:hypothetical protein
VPGLENTRSEWEQGYRRLQEHARDPVRYERLMEHVELVTSELRRRVGSVFTLAELADAYEGADVWSLTAIEENAPYPGWVRTASLVQDAAFHLYSRRAQDYSP